MPTDLPQLTPEQVYDTYADMLYRVSVSILQSRADADDAVQNAFCRYLESAPSFRDKEHEKAWLIRVTVNQCKDLLRRRKIRAWLPFDELPEMTAPETGSPVLDAVAALPDKYREVVILYHLEEMSVRETAAALTLSDSAVKMRLARAREMMRDYLTES